MAGRVAGKVAFITGAARGQGRSHAIRLAQEGADIIAVDLCQQVGSVPYPMATPDDLAETVREVEALDRRIIATQADVRDCAAVQAAVDEGVAQLGRLDIVAANAGIVSFARLEGMAQQMWQDMIDVNLTGVWNTAKAAIPHLKAAGGGSIVITSSGAGLKGTENFGHYVAAKHGEVGLMRALALELARDNIRVNTLNPGTVNTPMSQNAVTFALFRPDLVNPTAADVEEAYRQLNPMRVKLIEPIDMSNALLFLVSDEARYISGVTLPIDAGSSAR